MIDVLENEKATRTYAERSQFTFPVLLDSDGAVAASYALAQVLPDLPRNQVPIAANLIVDLEGNIRFYSLLDTTSFDAKLVGLIKRLDTLLHDMRKQPPE